MLYAASQPSATEPTKPAATVASAAAVAHAAQPAEPTATESAQPTTEPAAADSPAKSAASVVDVLSVLVDHATLQRCSKQLPHRQRYGRVRRRVLRNQFRSVLLCGSSFE